MSNTTIYTRYLKGSKFEKLNGNEKKVIEQFFFTFANFNLTYVNDQLLKTYIKKTFRNFCGILKINGIDKSPYDNNSMDNVFKAIRYCLQEKKILENQLKKINDCFKLFIKYKYLKNQSIYESYKDKKVLHRILKDDFFQHFFYINFYTNNLLSNKDITKKLNKLLNDVIYTNKIKTH